MLARLADIPTMAPAEHYLERIRALPAGQLEKRQLMVPEFRLHQEARFSVYYAPFDYVHRPAKVVLLGITPGWQQMEIAFRVARTGLANGTGVEQVLRAVKTEASFAGAMRSRMCSWLDELNLPGCLGLTSSTELFGRGKGLLHTTSAIRYPVIKANGENWSGSGPSPTSSPVLRGYILDVLAPELAQVENALIVPLGVAVSKAVDHLVIAGNLDERRVLAGFPHPSGLNTKGPADFARRRDAMKKQVQVWFGGPSRRGPRPPTSQSVPSKGGTSQRSSVPTNGAAPRSGVGRGTSAAGLPGREELQALILQALLDLGGQGVRSEIKPRAIELGDFSEAQLRVPPPPSKVGTYPNQVEYQLDWAMNALKRSGHIHSPASTVWAVTATGQRRAKR